ncbi:MAG: hypothetical protein UT61_C0063G0004 [Candidatus Woesebacteria bacterium GW2011_GWA1_39_8]|uniref:Uncharacterized protein n=1 Tax=Candidatus Woesebacteria bacterium GW2011_GWA1_39_8 TaxID=1618552 RepID=A0A0G0SQG9_9BACT|nr:MAG: hypothetical protein UT61_C0063G0004 [Candidatus Woesebacteria bacterium GW2011_GWA1_39_8]
MICITAATRSDPHPPGLVAPHLLAVGPSLASKWCEVSLVSAVGNEFVNILGID